jgi:two-component system, chemotaxis family, chemotaxis protein CheY
MQTKKVMIVDDSRVVRMQVKQALTEAGFSVSEAVDGVDALQKMKDSPDLALIVCDVNMPNMNGIEFLERKGETPDAANLPVLMLTTEGQPELIRRARSLGARAWMVKPFNGPMLVAAVRKMTGQAA